MKSSPDKISRLVSFRQTIESIIVSLRPRQVVLPWTIFSCTLLLFLPHAWVTVFLAALLFICMHGIVCIHNDIADRETDQINDRRDIPLASDQVSEKRLLIVMSVLASSVALISISIGYAVLPWVSLYLFAGWLYSGPIAGRNNAYGSITLLALCYGVIPWLMSASFTGQWLTVAPYACASFVFTFGIIVMKDYKDAIGDRATGKRTLVVSRGSMFLRRHMLIFTTIAYAVAVSFSAPISLIVALTGVVCLIINYLLLMQAAGTNVSPAIRRTHGHAARALFFIYCVVSYVLVVNTTR